MNYLIRGTVSALTQRLRSVRGWVILLLLPALVLGVQMAIPQQEVTAPVQVGVALPEEGGQDLWRLLEDRSGTVLTFQLADADTIDRNVAAGRWDCGVVIAQDFAQRIAEGNTDKLFTLRIAEGSAVYALVQEAVSACMAELLGPQIGAQYLERNGIAGSDAQQLLEAVLADADRVEVAMRTADGRPMDALQLADRGIEQVLQWLVSAVLLVWMLLCGAELGAWGCSGAVRRMKPLRPMTGLLLGKIGADMFLGVIAACCAMVFMGSGLTGCVAAIVYVLFLGGCAVLAARIRPVWSALPMLPPFLVVVSLLVSAALVDLSTTVPILLWAPGRLFLQICRGQWTAALPLVGAGALCVGISAILDGKQEKERKVC